MSDAWAAVKELVRLVSVELAGQSVSVAAWEESAERAQRASVHVADLSYSRDPDGVRAGGVQPTATSGSCTVVVESSPARGRGAAAAMDAADVLADSVVRVVLRQNLGGFLDGRVMTSVQQVEGPVLLPTDQGNGAVVTVTVSLDIWHA